MTPNPKNTEDSKTELADVTRQRDDLMIALETTKMLNNRRPALYAKVATVMKKVAYLKKDDRNPAMNYSYISAAKVKERISEAFAEVGLVTNTVCTLIESRQLVSPLLDSKTKNVIFDAAGNPVMRTSNYASVKAEITISDVDTGEGIIATGIGEGVDTGDKAAAKAQSMAVKYALTESFLIATGDDPEADTSTDQNATASQFAGSPQQRPGVPYKAAQPPAQRAGDSPLCPVHMQGMKFIPPGISKKTGNPYNGFYACQTQGCTEKRSTYENAASPSPAAAAQAAQAEGKEVVIPDEVPF